MRCLLRAAEALAGRRRVRLLLLLLRQALLRLVRGRRELLGQAHGADRLALRGLLGLRERPLELHLPELVEQDAGHPLRLQLRA
jgi:hypothetical protein